MSALAESADRVANAGDTLGEPWTLLAIKEDEAKLEYASAKLDAVQLTTADVFVLQLEADGRIGTATVTTVADPAVIFQRAIAAAAVGPRGVLREKGGDQLIPRGEDCLEPLSVDQAVRSGEPVVGAMQEASGLSVHATQASISRAIELRSSHGLTAGATATIAELSMVCEGRTDSTFAVSCTEWSREPRLDRVLIEWVTAVSGCETLPDVPLEPDTYDVVLAPAAVHTILTPLIEALSGAAVVGHRSFLSRQLGSAVCNTAITVTDEPTPADWPLWTPFDDEGTATRAMTLIDHGIAKGLYHSVETAAALNETPTGHGFRGTPLRRVATRPVLPTLGSIRVDAPTASLESMLAGVRRGLLIESLIGANLAPSLSSRTQGQIRLALLIEKGEVVGRVAGVPVAFDVLEVLGSRFVTASTEVLAAGWRWYGVLPFVLADAVPLGL